MKLFKIIKKHRHRIILVMVLIVMLSFSMIIILKQQEKKIYDNKERATFFAISNSKRIEINIKSLRNESYTLATLIRRSKGEVKDFLNVAAGIKNMHPEFNSIALAPAGIVDRVYPYTGEKFIGENLLKDSYVFKNVRTARESSDFTFKIVNDENSKDAMFVGRLPVYIEEKDNKIFWGFVCITEKMSDILGESDLNLLAKQNYMYEIHKIDVTTNTKQILKASRKSKFNQPISKVITVPNTTWTFSIEPRDGWYNKIGVYIQIIIGVVISVLVVGILKAMIDLNSKKRELEEISFTDSLTGLPNRRKLLRKLDDFVNDNNANKNMAICYMDVDGFKEINDTLGHSAGDKLLNIIATRIEKGVGTDGFAARIGGDEFVLVLSNYQNKKDCITILKRIQNRIRKPIQIEREKISISASMGIAIFNQDAKEITELIDKADAAMYEVKKRKENYCCFYQDIKANNKIN